MRPKNLLSGLRIVGAIAAKDVADAIKSRVALVTLLAMGGMLLTGRLLPLLTESDVPTVIVHDPGESALIEGLAGGGVRVHHVSSLEALEDAIREGNGTALGLAVPAGVDGAAQAGGPVDLAGYAAHWADPDDVAGMVAGVEEQLRGLAGVAVRIDLEGNLLYPRATSGGRSFMVSVYLVVGVLLLGIMLVPALMVAEKESKTLAALLVSPASYSQVVLGKALAGMFTCLLGSGMVFAFHPTLVNHWGLAIAATLCGSLFAVSVGLLMGILFDDVPSLHLWTSVVAVVFITSVILTRVVGPRSPAWMGIVIPWLPPGALARLFQHAFAAAVAWGEAAAGLGVVAGSGVVCLVLVAWQLRRMDR